VEQGSKAYQQLKESGAYTVLLEYPSRSLLAMPEPVGVPAKLARGSGREADRTRELKVGCIGAGTFARDTIFPALRKNRGVALHSVATASGVASESARHDSHAHYVIAGF